MDLPSVNIKSTHTRVMMVNQNVQGRQQIDDGGDGGRRVLIPAQVDNDPGHVAKERDGDVGLDEREKRRDDAHIDDIVTKLWSVTDDVACKR